MTRYFYGFFMLLPAVEMWRPRCLVPSCLDMDGAGCAVVCHDSRVKR